MEIYNLGLLFHTIIIKIETKFFKACEVCSKDIKNLV